jgi:hypothetical protein
MLRVTKPKDTRAARRIVLRVPKTEDARRGSSGGRVPVVFAAAARFAVFMFAAAAVVVVRAVF